MDIRTLEGYERKLESFIQSFNDIVVAGGSDMFLAEADMRQRAVAIAQEGKTLFAEAYKPKEPLDDKASWGKVGYGADAEEGLDDDVLEGPDLVRLKSFSNDDVDPKNLPNDPKGVVASLSKLLAETRWLIGAIDGEDE